MPYDITIRAEAVERVLNGESRKEVARSLGVCTSSVQNWVKGREAKEDDRRVNLRGGFVVGGDGRELLVCAVIEQAFKDATGREGLPMSAADRETARVFFEDDEGLDVLCDVAGLELPRNKLKRMAKRGEQI